jgi:hypothetical protein
MVFNDSGSTMRDVIQKTIDVLKLRVKSNLDEINKNQEAIKKILKKPNSPERRKDFEKHYSINKNLLSENNDYINVQLTLINFLEKYKDTALLKEHLPIVDVYSITDEKEVFDLTVKNILPFDSSHPQHDNPDFISKLIDYYETNEAYEKCQELVNIKNQVSKVKNR